MNRLWQNLQSPRIVVAFSFVIFFFLSISLSAQKEGEQLFNANCSSCHNASSKASTGPGLMGVLSRIPSKDWAHAWVHNSAKVIASGDQYATGIYAKYNKSNMKIFGDALTDAQIDEILDYADPGPKEPKGGPVANAGTPGGGATTTTDESNPVFIILILLILLIVLIAVLRYTKINLRNAVLEKEGLPEQPAMPFLEASRHWMQHHKRKVAMIGIFIFCVFIVKGWYALKGIGVYAEEVHPDEWVGYHPSQPINFSHKIHAGDNAIQCQYCHSGVEKSKTAGIPPVMVCMNCHKVIDQTANEGSKEEIAKIYFATGWDPAKRAYSNPQHPIIWNKVHVLPDFVFFSHQQHVVVGQVACDQCHGDVKTMTTIEQQRPLTMGWCVNCHRETPVKMEGNGYYTALHEKMKEKYKNQPITEAMVGGIECGRCHY